LTLPCNGLVLRWTAIAVQPATTRSCWVSRPGPRSAGWSRLYGQRRSGKSLRARSTDLRPSRVSHSAYILIPVAAAKDSL
jgi:hypothetical protein